MNARTASLLAVVMIACTEEPLDKIPDMLPITILEFQSTSMTLVEGQKTGECGALAPVTILTSEAPQGPTLYYVIMQYRATDLGGGTFASRFFFESSHTKFDGTASSSVILKNSIDEQGILTTVIQMEFEKGSTSSRFSITALDDDLTEADEIAKLEVATTNPVSGVCPSQLTLGERKSMDVTIKDFN
jgi:hypothetical protein